MTLTQILLRLGGVATRASLVRASSRKAFDAAVARGDIVRDGYGRYALPVADEALRAANRLSGVVSHRSAALHWGWEVKAVPDRIRRKRHLADGQADGVVLHWADLKPDEMVDMVTSVDRTLVDCVRSLPFDEALAVADSALRHRSITKAWLTRLADGIVGPGARQARRVAREATHLAANPFESVLRAIALDVPGIDLKPQVVIADERDCRRYTKLVLLRWRVLRFAWEDVMFHPDYVRECFIAAADYASRQADPAAADNAAA